MQVVYANQTPPNSWKSAIFLAGPTPRNNPEGATAKSWRPEALEHLESLHYDGVVFVPEDKDGTWLHNYDDQIEWEEKCLNYADIIIFWIPRELELMPAFTTNDEWGYWKATDPTKLVLGTPPNTPKIRYQQYYADKLHIPQAENLKDTCLTAVEKIGDTTDCLRSEGERNVPLHIWRTQSFKTWYQYLLSAGNRLDHARVEWVLRAGQEKQIIFFWTMHVAVYITAEDRHKTNEVVIGRPDISTILLYERCDPVEESRIVVVKEFRSPVANDEGYVFELAGGSSWDTDTNPLQTAVEECAEEVGLSLAPDRFTQHETNQIAPTALSHQLHLFSAELSTEEMNTIAQNQDIPHGVTEDSERTWAHVYTYNELLNSNSIDWSTLGMISKVLHS
jgi:8-oxo-dGTP pyrophosphatase MutT (NUDIX family)